MISVSESWKNAHQRMLLPESFLEISVGITDVEARDLVTAVSNSEAVFSNLSRVVGDINTPTHANYATLEHNLWVLDGSRHILPDTAPYSTPGYVSADDTPGNVTLSLPHVYEKEIPGFIITWSSEYNEYPTAFTIEVKRGDAVVASASVTDNASVITEIPLTVSDYDRVEVSVLNWNTPDHRTRIDRIAFGHVYVLGKSDVLSYTHEQHGDPLSGELPKNSIQFSINNVDGKWNPNNPTGLGKYLSERQTINVRYGLYVNSAIEWIKAGTFYITEWRAPANGLAAHFAARDVFEYMINETYTGRLTGTAEEIINNALSVADLPSGFVVSLDSSLRELAVTIPEGKYTVAEVIQMCANAACCVIYQDREGVLHIEPLNTDVSDYVIGSFVSYAHPEVELSKPLKSVSVAYGNKTYVLDVSTSGETQTVNNPFVSTLDVAESIAVWVREMLKHRTSVTGDFRADPSLDAFDVVTVESKYGIISPVVITDVKYTYSGAFHASYNGRLIEGEAGAAAVLDNFILDRDVLS